MGIIADLFVATPPEAAVYEETLLRDYAAAEAQFDPAHPQRGRAVPESP